MCVTLFVLLHGEQMGSFCAASGYGLGNVRGNIELREELESMYKTFLWAM